MSKKEPKIKTLKDKGATVDWVRFPDGREAFIFQQEKFRGIEVYGFKVGTTDKYKVISPTELSQGTLDVMSEIVTNVSGSRVKSNDINVTIEERISENVKVTVGDKKEEK